MKKGGFSKKWLRRYFVLYRTCMGHILCYYADHTETVRGSVGAFVLCVCVCVCPPSQINMVRSEIMIVPPPQNGTRHRRSTRSTRWSGTSSTAARYVRS